MKRILFLLFVIVVAFSFTGCLEDSKTTQEAGEREQEGVMERARAAYPTPQVDEFLTRKAVIEWVERMDQPGKIFYIYVMSDVGTITHYFVAQYRPVSVGTYLTPTNRLHDDYDWGAVLPAPSLDGTYYGTGGGGDQYFFFDAETDAYIELKGLNYIVSDQPFEIDVPQLNFVTE